MNPESMPIDRRSLLAGLAALIGASAVPSRAFAQEAAGAERFLAPPLFAILDEVAEIIIPATDTPGARGAGVPVIIDGLMRDWASAEHRRQFEGVLLDIDASARSQGGSGLLALPPARRFAVVAAYDAAKMGEPAYRRFKELVLKSYYLSEVGATQELRYELVPGSFQGGVPVGPDTRAWAV